MRSLRYLFVFALAAMPLHAETWLKCHIRVPDNLVTPQEKDLWRDSMVLTLGEIRGPFSVFLNGQKIAEGASSAAGKRLKVPKGILEKSVFNTLAVRLENDERFSQAPVFRTYFDELVLAGEWEKFSGDAAALKPFAQAPEKAAFTEKGFRLSTMPLVATENMPGQRLSPAESLAKMRTEPGLAVELLLAEPLVAQPTHMSFDERGRLWVSQYRQYPYPAGIRQLSRDQYYRAVFDKVPPPPPNHDRGADIISVHEDTDGDGVFDKHKNVLEGLNMANAAVYGHGGIWVMNTPYLMFYPDKNGDDIPDGPPEVRLAGFGLEDTHSVANGLVWGPDGWLYGGQGSTTTSRVTRAGFDTPPVYFEGCMVWRYHPERKIYEIFAEGGGNTFGLEFDAEGNLFSGHNGGDTRGWHFIQNGIYLKQGKDAGKFGATGHEFSFGDFGPMKSANPIQRFTHNIIMAEGTAVPTLRGKLLGADPLHRNITASERIAVGATFSTKDTGIPLAGDDIAFRPVFLANAPDGSVYVADFYEEYIAHGQNYQGQLDPTTGRIYRLRGKDAPLERDLNLKSKTTPELIALLRHPNKWHRMTAVRLLGERKDLASLEPLKKLLAEKETHPALEALWALHQMGQRGTALDHPAPYVRAWSIRLIGDAGSRTQLISESGPPKAGRQKWTSIENMPSPFPDDQHPIVQAQLASTARRLSSREAWPIIRNIIVSDENHADPLVPLLCWWTIERYESPFGLLALEPFFWNSRLALEHVVPRVMRRFASAGTRADFLAAAQFLTGAPAEHRASLVAAFESEFKGRQIPPLPDELVAALVNAGSTSIGFRIRQGDATAVADALMLIADPKAKLEERLLCIRTLGETKTASAVPPLLALATSDASAEVRKAALGALLPFDDAQIGTTIAGQFAAIPKDAQPAAITLLASRDATRPALLTLVENGTLRASDVPPDAALWLREKSADRDKAARLFPAAPAAADRAQFDRIRGILADGNGNAYDGEAAFMARCAACHQLFHKGGKIGPNLTAYQREDLGTVLTSILTPNAEIREGFENFTITTKDGRTLGGFLADKDANVITLRGLDGQDIALPREQITEMKSAGRSLMPEGLLEGLTDQQLRDFFAYLRIPQPISK